MDGFHYRTKHYMSAVTAYILTDKIAVDYTCACIGVCVLSWGANYWNFNHKFADIHKSVLANCHIDK